MSAGIIINPWVRYLTPGHSSGLAPPPSKRQSLPLSLHLLFNCDRCLRFPKLT